MSPHAARRRLRATTPTAHGGVIRLHIERIVVHGAGRAEALRIAAAIGSELGGLAAQPGVQFRPADAARVPTARVPTARVAAGPTPERTGQAVAGAVWSGITGAGQGGSQ